MYELFYCRREDMENLPLDLDEKLENGKNLKEVFAAIAHQWRAPLSQINSIVGSIDNRLYEQKIDDPFIEKQLLQIEAITKKMSQSVDDYRGYFSKKNEKHFFKELIEKNLKEEFLELEEEGISYSLDIADDALFVGDELLLKQIIVSLVENAKDALLERNVYVPKIMFEAFMDNSFLVIKVADNAGGISKSVMEKIFDSGFTSKHSSEGTGLGLFMVKKILDEKLNASIDVKNVASGACFTLKIPRISKV